MPFTRPDITREAWLLAGSPAQLDQEVVEVCLDLAVRRYSVDRPRVIVYSVTGDGSTVDFPLPSDFVTGLSNVLAVEYPAGSRTLLDPLDWAVVYNPQPVLRFYAFVIPSGQVARAYLTVPHVVHELDSSQTTVPDADRPALAALTGSYIALAASGLSARSLRAGLDEIPIVPGPAAEFRNLARQLEETYRQLLGVGDSYPPTLATGSVAYEPSWTRFPARPTPPDR